MVCQKDLLNYLICIFSIKESFVSLSQNIDMIELCYMLGKEYRLRLMVRLRLFDVD